MKKLGILFLILAVISGLVFFFRNNLTDLYKNLSFRLPGTERGLTDLLEEAGQKISTPEPLRIEKEIPQAFLTQAGVIKWTNNQREKFGLPTLEESAELDASAALKTEDMFMKQYFAHISQTGEGVADLAKTVNYEFIAIGENLALGNFKDDETLVQAWMDSPGHRANILNSQYQDIGVSVLKCTFEGKVTWLAVQHFGLSTKTCPQPDKTQKATIDSNQQQITELSEDIKSLQIEIKTLRPRWGETYTQKIEQYNALVEKYNNLISETEKLINEYNGQVKLFNDCIGNLK